MGKIEEREKKNKNLLYIRLISCLQMFDANDRHGLNEMNCCTLNFVYLYVCIEGKTVGERNRKRYVMKKSATTCDRVTFSIESKCILDKSVVSIWIIGG